jgi:hypothetical protein
METLGDSQISVTADLYTHVLKPRQRSASEAVDTLILGGDDEDDPDDGLAGALVPR